MNRFHFSWLLGLLVAITAGCDRSTAVGSMDSEACTQGQTKLADDGCNNCSCGTDGTWACTDMACVGAGGTAGVGGATSVGGAGGEGGQCLALPVCDAGDTKFDGTCPTDTACYERSLCGTTIHCQKPSIGCVPNPQVTECSPCWCDTNGTWVCNTSLEIPVCDTGDTQIDNTCPADASCYERSLCGVTIRCLHSSPQPCPIGAVRQSDADCNNCTCHWGGWSCTEIYCPLSCTPGSAKASSDGCNSCACGAAGTWECTNLVCLGVPCATGVASYQAYRTQTLSWAASAGCTTNLDCSLIYETNQCSANCGTAVSTASAEYFSSEMSKVAAANCASCPAPSVAKCAAMNAVCEAGTCVAKAL